MQKKHTISQSKKNLPALVAGLIMTFFIGMVILAFGLNALINQNVSVAQAVVQPDTQFVADQATVQDLQATILQYQVRETQYQNELQQAADQLNQASQQNQQYQQLIQALQNAGVIQISNDGRVLITHSTGFSAESEHDDD